MKAALKKKWVKALRSGDFKQAQYQLRKTTRNYDTGEKTVGHCCLGVLCEVAGKRPHRWDDGVFGKRLQKEFDLELKDIDDLVVMNDGRGWKFTKIARWIEKNL